MTRLSNSRQTKKSACVKRVCPAALVKCVLITLIVTKTVHAQTPQTESSPNESGIAALLKLYDLSATSLSNIPTNAEIENEPALIQALEAIRRVPPHKRIDWQLNDVDWAAATRDDSPYSGELVLLQGRVRRIVEVPLPAGVHEQLGTSDVYACEIELANTDLRARVYTISVPRRLLPADTEQADMDQRISASALIINGTNDAAQQNQLLLLAESLSWHPNSVNAALGIGDQHVWLANQGVDIATLDDVRDDAPMSIEDRAGFYQLLAAANRWHDDRIVNAHPQAADITKLLRNPSDHRARFFTLRGTARRAVSILVDQREISEIFGLKRYYEIEVFVEPEIPVVLKTDDAQRQFNRYPVVFCCRALPEGMPSGETIHEPVEITGVYLKTWAYPSAWIMEQTGRQDQMQISPLLIGYAPKWLAIEAPPLSFLERFGGWLFVAALGILTAFVWCTARGDRRAKRAFRERFADDAVDLNRLQIEPPTEFLNE